MHLKNNAYMCNWAFLYYTCLWEHKLRVKCMYYTAAIHLSGTVHCATCGLDPYY